MKKIQKGDYGYLNYQKKMQALIMTGCYVLVLAIFITGIIATKSRTNILTVMAILCVLPAARFTASFLALLPHKAVTQEEYDKVKKHTKNLILLTDLVITTGEKTLPTMYMVVHNGSVCGYTTSEKYDIAHAEKFLANNLMTNGQKATVKIFKEERQFLNRVDTMTMVETDERQQKKDERIRDILLTLIM